jgi:hypothetical protein
MYLYARLCVWQSPCGATYLSRGSLIARAHRAGFKLFGVWGAVVVKICVLVINFGAIVSYNIVLGDLISQLMEDFFCEDASSSSSSSSSGMLMDGSMSMSGGNTTSFASFDSFAADESMSLDLGPQCVEVITYAALCVAPATSLG